MAGDWLKFEKTTMDKPEVFEMASILQIDPDAVVGKLLRVWAWFDEQSRDGHAPVTVRALLERHTGVPDFVAAMKAVGWLIESNGCLILPNYERHNGSSAKSRAQATIRKQKSRSGHAGSVTQAGPEKRREEKNTPSECTPLPPGGDLKFPAEDLLSIVHSYPRRENDAQALEAVRASLRKGATLAEILAGTLAVAAVIPSLPSGHLNAFVVSAGRFFRDERWRDDPQTWKRSGGKHGVAVGKLDLGGRRAAPIDGGF
jgi:hypothetical protein